jgi:hypothetical protein
MPLCRRRPSEPGRILYIAALRVNVRICRGECLTAIVFWSRLLLALPAPFMTLTE